MCSGGRGDPSREAVPQGRAERGPPRPHPAPGREGRQPTLHLLRYSAVDVVPVMTIWLIHVRFPAMSAGAHACVEPLRPHGHRGVGQAGPRSHPGAGRPLRRRHVPQGARPDARPEQARHGRAHPHVHPQRDALLRGLRVRRLHGPRAFQDRLHAHQDRQRTPSLRLHRCVCLSLPP